MSIRLDTHTVHTITVDLPDDVLGKIEYGDEIRVTFNPRSTGAISYKQPASIRLSYAWTRFLMGSRG